MQFGIVTYLHCDLRILGLQFQVYGALRMSVKMFLMWNSKLLIDGGGDSGVVTSLLEASNLIVLRVI